MMELLLPRVGLVMLLHLLVLLRLTICLLVLLRDCQSGNWGCLPDTSVRRAKPMSPNENAANTQHLVASSSQLWIKKQNNNDKETDQRSEMLVKVTK
ncbi:hypothetical protein E3N88_28669 [Mikania micrantha]|uniref:Uncharacterized protein n=1 Tax=Mikania micrantha TaxID=192012 RepID=A0A5N6N0F6_9ASTR|nr:hypothetical protein E3N88_28669 [Mikania micrantha]